jgi:DNA-binding NarL/FixJ family response regulator
MTVTPPIRILCVDDHPLFRDGIAAVIDHQPDMTMVGLAANGRDALEQFRHCLPDVTLMDLRLPDMGGIAAVAAIRQEFPAARILILTTFEGDVEVQRALAAGARGYLLKNMPRQELIEAIRNVHQGKKHLPAELARDLVERMGSEDLTDREVEVLRELAEGSRNREIGQRLSVTEETIKAHVGRILQKLGAKDRTQAVAIAIRRGIIHF